jgi:mannose-6-phosphate isomerase-like protein (cupin superfamily)
MIRRTFIQKSLISAPLLSLAAVAEAKIFSPSEAFVTKAGKDRFNQPILYRGISPNMVKVSSKDTGGQFAIFEYEGLGKFGPELHIHLKQDEVFFVFEGEYLFQVGDEQQTLTTGDTIFLPRKVPHTWLQLTEKGKLVYLVQPAGKMEDFFKKMNSLTSIPTEAEVEKISLDHDIKVVGPPLTL